MDKETIIRLAHSIRAASETVLVAGEHNRQQLSGIYRAAGAIIQEMRRKEQEEATTDGGQDDR